MEGTDYYIKIGQTIKELRLKKNITRKQLADGICSISYISRIENGGRCPTSVILRQITNKLGISPEYLFRAIESPASLHVHELLIKLFLNIERNDLKNIYNLMIEEEKRLCAKSVHDIQILKTFKCVSEMMLTKNYKAGIDESKKILDLTYIKGNSPTDIEFSIMFSYGVFLLLDNQKKEAYNHLIDIKKYIDNIKFLHTYAMLPRFYMHLISVCLDLSLLEQSFSYLDFAIDYCKEYNTHAVLRELYFLKGELYYRLNKKKEFEIWYDKALTLNELIKKSDDEYFNTFVEDRLKKLKTS